MSRKKTKTESSTHERLFPSSRKTKRNKGASKRLITVGERATLARRHPLWGCFEAYCYDQTNGYSSITEDLPVEEWIPMWDCWLNGVSIGVHYTAKKMLLQISEMLQIPAKVVE